MPLNTTTQVTFNVRSSTILALESALVQINAFVNGTMQNVFSGLTDVSGNIVFEYETGRTYQVSVSKSGYVGQTFNNIFTTNAYTITLDVADRYSLTGDVGLSGVRVSYAPTDYNLSLGLITFNITTTNTSDKYITSQSVEVYNFTSDTVINRIGQAYRTQSSNASFNGGTVNVTMDMSKYNGSIILVKYAYQINNLTEYLNRLFDMQLC